MMSFNDEAADGDVSDAETIIEEELADEAIEVALANLTVDFVPLPSTSTGRRRSSRARKEVNYAEVTEDFSVRGNAVRTDYRCICWMSHCLFISPCRLDFTVRSVPKICPVNRRLPSEFVLNQWLLLLKPSLCPSLCGISTVPRLAVRRCARTRVNSMNIFWWSTRLRRIDANSKTVPFHLPHSELLSCIFSRSLPTLVLLFP